MKNILDENIKILKWQILRKAEQGPKSAGRGLKAEGQCFSKYENIRFSKYEILMFPCTLPQRDSPIYLYKQYAVKPFSFLLLRYFVKVLLNI